MLLALLVLALVLCLPPAIVYALWRRRRTVFNTAALAPAARTVSAYRVPGRRQPGRGY